jgi:threonine dehydrogenase-like Zn-dependent dehydrogenase
MPMMEMFDAPEEAPRGYAMFRDKADGCIKVVLQPGH